MHSRDPACPPNRKFVLALIEKDDEFALSLLEKARGLGRIRSISPIQGPYSAEWIYSNMMTHAITCGREKVIRRLADLGASLDHFRVLGRCGKPHTAAGFAINEGNVSMLSLCHELGGNMSSVSVFPNCSRSLFFMSDIGSPISAVMKSILSVRPDCLEVLLDVVNVTRPVELSDRALSYLCIMPRIGTPAAMQVLKVLQTRGFNFKNLEKKTAESIGLAFTTSALLSHSQQDPTERETSRQLILADLLIASAQNGGNTALMRYLLKDLGLRSQEGTLGSSKLYVDRLGPHGGAETRMFEHPEAPLKKYLCAACESVSATMWCTECKEARYCSSECQLGHWKTGGHRKECKERQRVAAEISDRPSASMDLAV